MGLRILDPSGSADRERVPLRPLPPSLHGLRLGYLDNTKWNVPLLLDEIDGALSQRYGTVRAQYERKAGPSWPATGEEINRFTNDIDLYLVAIGD